MIVRSASPELRRALFRPTGTEHVAKGVGSLFRPTRVANGISLAGKDSRPLWLDIPLDDAAGEWVEGVAVGDQVADAVAVDDEDAAWA